jgi:hypothetical protein
MNLLVAATLALAGAAAPLAWAKGPGKTVVTPVADLKWSDAGVPGVATAGADGDAETLTFANGRFRSTACDAYGYGDGAYRWQVCDGEISFEVETESPQYGLLRWQGVVRGPRLPAMIATP